MTIEELLAQLKDENAKTRRKACENLGELGDPQALPSLALVYEEDDNKQVRDAAAKALKKFAAKEGGKSRLKPLIPLLSLSLIALVVLNVLIWGAGLGQPTEASTPTPIPTPSEYTDLFTTVENDVFLALDDINALRAQWSAGAGNLTCEGVTLKSPSHAGVAEVDQFVYGNLGFVRDLDFALTRLAAMGSAWQAACASPEKGTVEQAEYALGILSEIEISLAPIAEAIFAAQSAPQPTQDPAAFTPMPQTPLPTLTLTPSPSPTITNTPRPTIDPTVLGELQTLVANNQSEIASLLEARWKVVQVGDISGFGCRGVMISDNYTSAPPELLAQEPDLAAAIDILNTALDLARQSNVAYEDRCQNNTFTQTNTDGWVTETQKALDSLGTVAEVLAQY